MGILHDVVLGPLFAITILAEILMLFRSWHDRKNAFKNYRHFMHISLLCQTIAYAGRFADMRNIGTV